VAKTGYITYASRNLQRLLGDRELDGTTLPMNRALNESESSTTQQDALRLLVREIMAKDPVFASPHASVLEAAALMNRRNIGAIVVCEHNRIVGILTERDLLRAAARGHRLERARVAELMTSKPFTVSADASWMAAADLMVERGVRHLPVAENGRLVGVLSVRDLLEYRNHYLEGLVRVRTAELEEKNAALEERDRLMKYHLDVAGRIQRQLLPAHPPELSSFAFALAYHPLERVSGDYYDFAILPTGRLGVLLADASGHSVPAAFVSVMAKTAFHAYAQGIESPAAVLRTMNHRLSDLMEAEHFITMFYGVLERETLRLTYALAGHPRPLWYRQKKGAIQVLDADGPKSAYCPRPCLKSARFSLVQAIWFCFTRTASPSAVTSNKCNLASAAWKSFWRGTATLRTPAWSRCSTRSWRDFGARSHFTTTSRASV